MVLVNVK